MPHKATIDEMFYGTVTVGERGQIVIPAEARSEHNISPGEKLLVFAHPHHLTGLSLVKLSGMSEFVEGLRDVVAASEKHAGEEQSSDDTQQGDD